MLVPLGSQGREREIEKKLLIVPAICKRNGQEIVAP
jgi:hypothetical protein